MHPWVVNRIIFPLHERLKGKRTHARLRELERTQWLAPEALRELQFRRVRRHLEFAYREVPYYTRLLDEHGLQPWRITSPEEFARIPHLTKMAIRRHFDDLQPRIKIGRVRRLSSGGSTGEPVSVLADMERMAFTDAARLRAQRWYGVDMGAREITLWGSPIELTKQDLLRKVRDRLINSRLLSAFNLGEPQLARYGEIIRRYRPQKIFAYSSALYLLARYLNRRGWTAEPGWPRAAFTTAELLDDCQRAMIQSVFGCPVAVEYGCREGGLIANECPAGGLHINADGMVVEVLRGTSENGGHGELVITNLDSFAMPIIRYRTGDVAALEETPCPCGRGLPRLRSLQGRRSDFLITPDGKVIHGQAAAYMLREVPSIRETIREFQVVQERLDRVRVTIVPDDGFSEATREAVAARLLLLFDGGVSVDVELADTIVRPASGKHRDVISKVADEYLEGLLEVK